ncbi:MAG: type II toxin-antitoxin system VapC family toxin [Armatimonadota bacterium]|nr:type II toxin-antitoxin system VapC family toxin [Armatimonadota bacterium]
MNYLLETTAVSDILRQEPNTVAHVNALSPTADAVAASVVTYGEIWFGLRTMSAGQRRQEGEQRAHNLFAGLPLESVTRAVADAYVQIKASLQQQGLLIPEADLWIAATSLAGGYILISRDAHFNRIAGITVENWSQP